MTLTRSLADALMRLATRRPSPARAEWALAMQREFDTLEKGELSWALGCLTTMMWWNLRKHWLYLLLLCAAPFLVGTLQNLPFKLLWWDVISRDSFTDFYRSYGAVWSMISPLPLAFLLGAYRPASIARTVLFGLLLHHIWWTLEASFSLGGSFLSWWHPRNATLYMAPPLVGLCASFGVWYLGASGGARWARRRQARAR